MQSFVNAEDVSETIEERFVLSESLLDKGRQMPLPFNVKTKEEVALFFDLYVEMVRIHRNVNYVLMASKWNQIVYQKLDATDIPREVFSKFRFKTQSN
jgi:hypothetical protein